MGSRSSRALSRAQEERRWSMAVFPFRAQLDEALLRAQQLGPALPCPSRRELRPRGRRRFRMASSSSSISCVRSARNRSKYVDATCVSTSRCFWPSPRPPWRASALAMSVRAPRFPPSGMFWLKLHHERHRGEVHRRVPELDLSASEGKESRSEAPPPTCGPRRRHLAGGALDDLPMGLMVQLWNAPVDFLHGAAHGCSSARTSRSVGNAGRGRTWRERTPPWRTRTSARSSATSRRRFASTYFDLFLADRTQEIDDELEAILNVVVRAAEARVLDGQGRAGRAAARAGSARPAALGTGNGHRPPPLLLGPAECPARSRSHRSARRHDPTRCAGHATRCRRAERYAHCVNARS